MRSGADSAPCARRSRRRRRGWARTSARDAGVPQVSATPCSMCSSVGSADSRAPSRSAPSVANSTSRSTKAGIGGGEQGAHRAALGDRRRAPRARRTRGLHHRAHVVHALLQRRHALEAVGHALAALVEADHAEALRQAPQHARVVVVLPVRLEVRDDAGDEHQVLRTAAEHLVGDAQAVALGVAGFGDRQLGAHPSSLWLVAPGVAGVTPLRQFSRRLPGRNTSTTTQSCWRSQAMRQSPTRYFQQQPSVAADSTRRSREWRTVSSPAAAADLLVQRRHRPAHAERAIRPRPAPAPGRPSGRRCARCRPTAAPCLR